MERLRKSRIIPAPAALSHISPVLRPPAIFTYIGVYNINDLGVSKAVHTCLEKNCSVLCPGSLRSGSFLGINIFIAPLLVYKLCINALHNTLLYSREHCCPLENTAIFLNNFVIIFQSFPSTH